MKKLVVLALTAAMAATYAVAIHAEGEPVNFVKGTAVMDGKLDDFIKAGVKPIHVEGDEYARDAPDVADNAFDFYFMNDAKNAYVAFDVKTPVIGFNKSGGDIWNQTGVEVWFGNKQYGAALDPDDQKTPIFAWDDVSAIIGAAYAKTDKGFIFELAFDLAAVSEVAPDYDFGPGASFPISFGVDNTDDEMGNRIGQLYYPLSWVWGQPDSFATATLAK